jgi:hypothetical protein
MVHFRAAFLIALLAFSSLAFAQETSSSALISEQLDKQIDSLNVQGGLFDVMSAIEAQTSVRIEAVQSVYDALPWGQDTSISVNVRNTTLRQVLDTIGRHLGLKAVPGDQAVVFEPTPALRRLGRRATLDEIQALDLLAATPLSAAETQEPVAKILQQIDAALTTAKSPFAIETRGVDSSATQAIIGVDRNTTLMDALDEISDQTDATWYPWGQSIVIVPKVEATRLLLSKRITTRFRDVPLQQVLLELAEQSGATFQMTPGVLQKVPPAYAKITLILDDATIDQALQSISGATGLAFTPTSDGISVTLAAAATQPVR